MSISSDWKTKKSIGKFELQILKISASKWARIIYKEDKNNFKIVANFTSSPISVGVREACKLFENFDFSDIFQNQEKQIKILDLIPTHSKGFRY